MRVEHIAPLAAWEVEGSRHRISDEAKISYCTPRKDAVELLQIGLNGAAPVVYDTIYDSARGGQRQVRNADDTEAAEAALNAIAERFSLWVWENPAREQRILYRYNHTMNCRVLRRHDGAHLTFPGLADGVTLWPWQRDFVDQAVSSPAAMAAHEMGLGKTLTAITPGDDAAPVRFSESARLHRAQPSDRGRNTLLLPMVARWAVSHRQSRGSARRGPSALCGAVRDGGLGPRRDDPRDVLGHPGTQRRRTRLARRPAGRLTRSTRG